MSGYPDVRLRRLRQTPSRRRLFDAPLPGPSTFIWPVFVKEGQNLREPIAAMPGQFRLSPDTLLRALEPVVADGIGGLLVFGLPRPGEKDKTGTAAAHDDGIVQQAVRAVKRAYPDLVVATDVCLCAYTDHGHCGLLDGRGRVDNDGSLAMLARVAVSHAAAGADMVAPSAMMDGQVAALRRALDSQGLADTLLMSYSTKFASGLYGPFREAEQSAPGQGDRKGYQASYADVRTALRESALDEAEGADILMVKPSLYYLDIVARLRERTELPLAVYQVSGEYAMAIAAAERGWADLKSVVRESVMGISRAGADLIITYWAGRYREIFHD